MNKNNKTTDVKDCMPKDYSSPISGDCKIHIRNNRSSFAVIHFFFYALMPIPIAFLYAIFLGRWIGATPFHAVFIAPLMEEFFKISGVLLFTIIHPDKITSHLQILWASVIASLSFAVIENILYAYIRLAHVSDADFVDIMTFRWVFLTLIHILCTIIASMGIIHLWKCHENNKKAGIGKPILFFAIAVVIHALYNGAVLML